MKTLSTIIFPTLALAAAILDGRQEAPVVEIINARIIGDGGNGCRLQSFSHPGTDKDTATLIFDGFSANIAIPEPGRDRESHCEYEIITKFPLGCTTALFESHPTGFAALQDGSRASFHAQYNMYPETSDKLTVEPLDVEFTSDQGGTTIYNFWNETHLVQVLPVKQNIREDNNRNITFRASTRIWLNAPGSTQESYLTVDALVLRAWDAAAC